MGGAARPDAKGEACSRGAEVSTGWCLFLDSLACPDFVMQVPLKEQKAWEGLSDLLPRVRHAAEHDRNIMEKGTRAFVSYVRGYREHQVRIPSGSQMESIEPQEELAILEW